MQFIESLLTPEELENNKKVIYPFNLKSISEALCAKLDADPNYEVFLPLVYFRHKPSVTTPGAPIKISPYKYFISNKGRVVNLRNPLAPKYLEETVNSDGYPSVTITIRKKAETITIHRAIACAFVGVSDEVAVYHPRDLIVVHKDNDPLNYQPYNLKWTTPPEKH